MSDQDSTPVLGEPAQADQADAAKAPASDVSSLLASITNENGEPKYKSVDEAIKALQHSQEHIRKLEDENREKAERLAQAKAAEDILEKLSAKSTPAAPPAAQVLDDATIEEVINRKLTEREKADLVKKNQTETANVLKAKYGDKYQEVYKAKAQELGVSVEFLNDAAAKSPKAVLNMFGLEATGSKDVPSKVHSSVNTETPSKPAEPKSFRMNGSSFQSQIAEWRRHRPEV